MARVVVGNISKCSWGEYNTGRPVRYTGCSVQESRHFDTHLESNAATELSSCLQQVGRCYIIVGVTGDEPRGQLHAAVSTLREIGVDVVDVEHRGSFAFVAQSGYPAMLRKVLTENESYTNPAHYNVTVTGAIVHLHCFNKKLSYRRGTARCVVSVEILPIAMQQCSTTSLEQIEVMKLEG